MVSFPVLARITNPIRCSLLSFTPHLMRISLKKYFCRCKGCPGTQCKECPGTKHYDRAGSFIFLTCAVIDRAYSGDSDPADASLNSCATFLSLHDRLPVGDDVIGCTPGNGLQG